MPYRIVAVLDLLITGMISVYALIFSFGFIPIVVAFLNGIYIISRIRRDANEYHDGSIWKYLEYIVKKN